MKIFARLLVDKKYSANWVLNMKPIKAGTIVPVVKATNIPQKGDAIRYWIDTPELHDDPYGIGLYDGEFKLVRKNPEKKKKRRVTRKDAPRGSSLRDAVIEQLGGGEEAEDSLRDVANHGAAGGYPGFTYTRDTVKFFDANEDAIMSLADSLADELGEKNVWTMIGGFSQAPSADIDSLKNSLAWFALESVANDER